VRTQACIELILGSIELHVYDIANVYLDAIRMSRHWDYVMSLPIIDSRLVRVVSEVCNLLVELTCH
jgi:hypothetical protein